MLLQQLTTDPASPAVGQIWYNSTSQTFKYQSSSGTQILGNLNTVVQSLLAGNGTITVGGTATNPTVAVAKTLDHTYITDFLTTVEAVALNEMAAPTAAVSMAGQSLTTLADPVNPQDAVNFRTLLNNILGLSASQSVQYATVGALPANTYNNGASGVGATLTATANGGLVIDSQAVSAGQRVLVLNEATYANNGIYAVTTPGSAGSAYVLTRSTDFNSSANIGPGIMVPVEAAGTAGTQNNGKVFISVSPSAPTVGTTAIAFTLIGSTYSAGVGLTLTGTQFALTAPVTVALGGTGATTAAAAKTSLGYTTKYATTIGDGATLIYTITHNLGTTDLTVDVWETTGSLRKVIVDQAIVDSNHCTVTFASAPAANAYRVVVGG